MQKIKDNAPLVLGVVLLIFSVLFFVAAKNFSDQGSYVEVKGLSERIVKADTAIWSIGFDVRSNDVDSLYANIQENTKAVTDFWKEMGFEDAEINVAPVNIYQDTYKDALFRYNSSTQISLYTQKVDLVKTASKDTLDLLKKGVVMNQNYVSFEFSDINSVKPEMLKEAMENAMITAESIAQEANSRLGALHKGNQGVFDISQKDPGSPEYKKIRLVSTLQFLLQ